MTTQIIRRIFVLISSEFAFVFCVLNAQTQMQPFGAGCDTVFVVRWGTGQTFGREFFPQNVLGLPDTTARAEAPSANPRSVCSLGMGGEIVLGWKNAVLVNRPGVDFTVFENPFIRFDNRVFAEPAKIAVSKDGRTFVEFPFDSLSLQGCAGITPTRGNQSPFNPQLSGGDSFDLAKIGMDSVRFVKITDISAMVLGNPKHPFFDPTISGFDLDAVVGLHCVRLNATTAVRETQRRTQQKKTRILRYADASLDVVLTDNVGSSLPWKIELYSVLGQRVFETISFSSVYLQANLFAKGVYFLVLRQGEYVETETIQF